MDTKKLRQKVLDLAIRGKLVPQDPNDEPASVLLERIRKEKERLIKEGKIKRNKKEKTSDTSHYRKDLPFELPQGWVWTKVSTISSSIQYGITESAKSSGNYKFLRITDIQDNLVKWNSVPYVCVDDDRANDYLLHNNDIVFARTGATVGKSYLIENLDYEAVFASYLIRIKSSTLLNAYYIKLFLESGFYWEQIVDKSVGIGQPNVNGTSLGELIIPIPPSAEQDRIVSEIQRLFSFIDIVEENKLSLEQFVKLAKSKVLDLAIRGELVQQDSTDEPASALLKRLKGECKTPKSSSDISHYPFEVPEGWVWCRLGEIGTWQSGATPNRTNKDYYNGNILWLKTGDLTDSYIYNIPETITEKALQETSVKLNPSGSILIAMYGATIGKVGILTTSATTNQACCACSGFKGIYNLYLFYVLIAYREYFISKGEGGAQPNISKEKITTTYIPVPSLAEQKRIVSKIEQIFSNFDEIEQSLKA